MSLEAVGAEEAEGQGVGAGEDLAEDGTEQ